MDFSKKTVETNENQRKSTKICGNQWKSKKIYENRRKSMENDEKTRGINGNRAKTREEMKLAGGPGGTCVSINGGTPSPRPRPCLPPRLFLPRACSSFPNGLDQHPSRGKEKKKNNTIAFSRGPVPPSRPGNFG